MFEFLSKSSDKELEEELIKQLTISNALKCLEAQYRSADSIMTVEEIKKHYDEICKEIFKEENNDKLQL